MSTYWLRPTTVLRGRLEGLQHGKADVSFEMEGRSIEFPERSAACPIEEGQAVTLMVRAKFWPSEGHVALAFAVEGEGKARPVGRGIHLLGVLFGLPLIAFATALRVMEGPSSYRGEDESLLWSGMIVGGVFVAYSAYRVVEISRAVKILREQLPTSSTHEKTGVS